MLERFCANCRRSIEFARCTGDSSLYNPGQSRAIELCEPCFLEEEAAIDEAGTNNLPERLARYRRNLSAGVAP